MEEVSRSGSLEKTGEGRGIVMVAGNADTLQRAIWSLKMLRSYNSSLTVQIVSATGKLLREELLLTVIRSGASPVRCLGRKKAFIPNWRS